MTYVMEHPAEGARIEAKTDRALTTDQLRMVGLRAGMSVLDLGCAAGTTTRLIAQMVGAQGRAVGIDASASRIDEARAATPSASGVALAEYRVASAYRIDALDAEFDLSWSRFLFEYLDRPAAALEEMKRVTRRGGVVAISDLDGNCLWHAGMDPEIQAELDAAVAALGADFAPRVGRELFTMCTDAGLRDIAIDVRPYHLIAGRIGEADRTHWRRKLAGVTPALLSRGWTAARIARLIDGFLHHLDSPRTLTYSVLFTVWGRRPDTATPA